MTAAIASVAYSANTGATSLAVTAPSGLASGELVVVQVDANTTAVTWSAPDASWALDNSNTTVAVFSHVATGSEPATWTFTRSGSNAGNRALAVRVTGHNGVDTSQIITRAARSSFAFTSMTAAEANSLIIYGTNSWASQTPWTSPGATTEFNDTADGLVAYEITAAAGATTARTFTANSAQNSSGFAIIILSSAGGSSANGTIKVTYQASNTFTCPTGVTSARVQCEGAGGPGGNGATLNRGGGGGGAAYAEEPTLTLVPGRTYTVTVPPTASTVGTAGGDAQFVDNVTSTVLVKAAGGGAGGNASGLSNGSAGAAGLASNSVGSITTSGTAGTAGGSGGAGATPLGGAGGTTGPGTAPGGGGGGGAALNGAGQAGAQGVVIVTFNYTTDSVAASDSSQLVVSWNRSFNETVSSVDSIAKLVLKPINETVTVSEDFRKTISSPKTETVATSDQMAKVIDLVRSETALTADTINKLMSLPEVASVLASDTEFSLFMKHVNPESVVSSDTISSILKKPVDETVVVSDFALVVLVFLRFVGDAVTAVDQISKYFQLSESDSVSILESTFKLVFKSVSIDAVTASDSALVQVIYSRNVSDSVSAVDDLVKQMHLNLADSISGSTVAPTTRKLFVTLSD